MVGRVSYWLPGLIIVFVLGSQISVSAYSAVRKHGGTPELVHQSWPFLDYPMYSRSSGPPVQADTTRLFAELPDGSRVEVTAKFIGLKYFAWRYGIVERLVAEPIGPDRPELAAKVEAHRIEARDKAAFRVEQVSEQVPVRFIVERTVRTLQGREIQTTTAEQSLEMPAGDPGELEANRGE